MRRVRIFADLASLLQIQPRIEGKVEIRPSVGISAPVAISYVTIGLYRRETIHPHAGSVVGNHLAAPRKDIVELVGNELRLFHCGSGKLFETVLAMDLPFLLFIPFMRDGEGEVPPASLQLPSRVAETYYELIVSVQQGTSDLKKFSFPVPISRYDTLSTFGMYNTPETQERVSDHLVTLGLFLPRWSFGPNDDVNVTIKLTPNPDWLSRARKVTVKGITVAIEEHITYNPEGDEPTTKVNTLLSKKEKVAKKLPEHGYMTTIAMTYPAKDLRDSDGFLPRQRPAFPLCAVSGFTTSAALYKINYYLIVKATMTNCKDITVKQSIVVTPFDHITCKNEMDAIAQAAVDAYPINMLNPMLPAQTIIRPGDHNALHALGFTYVGKERKLLIQ
ncbi:hypothetical protein BGX38DRAFT_124367 [Terfezia claveryi]|nr:hypothetical protein BGX38DRAFT_124367 [Terfezia claveryi]